MLECTQICDGEMSLHFTVPVGFGVFAEEHHSLQLTFRKPISPTENTIWKTGALHDLCYMLQNV